MPNVVEVEIFNKLFSSIAEEMGIILARSSFSPNIKERRDFSCAIFDDRGELVAQAAHIPVHLGAMPLTLRHVLSSFRLTPGDIVILNDPFTGGSHLPDITLIQGVFSNRPAGVDNRPLFYVVNRAHHADVGGRTPGSMGLTKTIEEEGVRIPPTLLSRKGRIDEQFLRNFLALVRNPSERQGDLKAQIAALQRGRSRLLELLDKYGAARISEIISHLKKYGERLMSGAIETIPDGRYEFTDYLDNDGSSRKPVPISVDLLVGPRNIIADFSRSGDQVPSPLNTVESVTVSAVTYVFQCLLGDSYPINHGSYLPLRVITRKGSILHATAPAAVAAGNVETSQRIVDVLLGALSKAIPERIPAASCGSMNNVAIGGQDRRFSRDYAYYETIGGGMGGSMGWPGLSGIHTHMTNTLNTPIEAFEHAYPLRIEKYGLHRNSGGPGKFCGGEGIIRSYRFLEQAEVSLLTERRRFSPYGLEGGGKGRKGENILIRKARKIRLPGKVNIAAQPGDLLIVKTPGGGGWGKI